MPTRLALLTLLLLLALAVPAGAMIVPGKGMAGVRLGDCQERAIEVLGPPDRTFGETDFAGFASTYIYVDRGLKLEFRRGPGECLELTSILTTKRLERTEEGVGKGTTRRTLRRRLSGEKCQTFRRPRRVTLCWLGSRQPARRVTDFRLGSHGRVWTVRVAIVID